MDLDLSLFFNLEQMIIGGSLGVGKPTIYQLFKVEKVAHIEDHIL